MPVVSNSSPIIHLAKIGKLNLLNLLFKEIIIPKEVFNEIVVRGKEEKFSEVLIIEEAMEKGWIKLKEIELDKKMLKFAPELDKGEIEVISLARRINASLVLIDDAAARKVSESFGLDSKGTVYVLLKAYKNKFISIKETKELINKLILTGFRISSELYAKLLKELEK